MNTPRFVTVLFSLLILASHSAAKDISICTDSNTWYPFTYAENGQSKGMHIDIASAALKAAGFSPSYHPIPWKRCLLEIKNGKYDALVSGSYKPARAEYLDYPADAANTKESAYRLMQVSYIVVSHSQNEYQYNGDLKTLPAPIRAPLGYSIVDDLSQQGLTVSTFSQNDKGLWDLIRSGKGVFVTTPLTAQMYNKTERFAGKLKIHDHPIKSKSYFLLFAKRNNQISAEDRKRIWESVARFRNDTAFMEALSENY